MNKFILINKSKNMTSYDVIRELKKQFNIKKIGHCGTLDPLATGLLIVAVGKEALKAIRFVNSEEKEYIATLKLGSKTLTGDVSGEIIQTKKVIFPSVEAINLVLNSLKGDSKQIPPFYSAKKINGQKLYKHAYKSTFLKPKPQNITIKKITFLDYNQKQKIIKFKCLVSKGTYIRTLCEDIAEKLNNIGTMQNLQRISIGKFTLKKASSLEEIKNFSLIEIKDMINLPIIEIKKEEYNKVFCGKIIPRNEEGMFKILKNNKIFSVVKVKNQKLFVIRNFNYENI